MNFLTVLFLDGKLGHCEASLKGFHVVKLRALVNWPLRFDPWHFNTLGWCEGRIGILVVARGSTKVSEIRAIAISCKCTIVEFYMI